MIVYNSFCCHDNGLSPSGKALDSDSSISEKYSSGVIIIKGGSYDTIG